MPGMSTRVTLALAERGGVVIRLYREMTTDRVHLEIERDGTCIIQNEPIHDTLVEGVRAILDHGSAPKPPTS